MTKDFRALIKDAQRKDRHDEQPDRTVDEIAAACCVNRAHLFDLMAGKPDPSLVKEWTIHRLAAGLDLPAETIREALKKSWKRKNSRERRSALLDE